MQAGRPYHQLLQEGAPPGVGAVAAQKPGRVKQGALAGDGGEEVAAIPAQQGLTPIHFSARLEPCLTHKNTPHTPKLPLNTGYATPTRPPYPLKSA